MIAGAAIGGGGNHNISQVQQPPYLPDLAPFVTLKIKSQLEGTKLKDVKEIKENPM